MAERQPLLTLEDLDTLNTALSAAESIEEDMLRAEQAGLDLTEARARLDTAKARARQIKQAFFPGS